MRAIVKEQKENRWIIGKKGSKDEGETHSNKKHKWLTLKTTKDTQNMDHYPCSNTKKFTYMMISNDNTPLNRFAIK